MTQYKVLIAIILAAAIALGSFIFWRESIIRNLEGTISENQQLIIKQDNKIKEQLSVINLLEEENKNKCLYVDSLLNQINETKANYEGLLKNKEELFSISAAGKTIPLEDLTNQEKKENQVVDKDTSENFINLRNNIIRNYQ